MLRPGFAALLLTALLAGCSGGGPGDPADDLAVDVPELEATATTGVIRAVVFDEAIRPLVGATVEVMGGETKRNATTDESGFAGFESLQPGTYFVKASKGVGFAAAQQSVEVVAGVSDPPAVKLMLTLRTGDLPFYQEYKIDAFLECSGGVGNWCFIANYYPCLAMQLAGQPCTANLTSDNSFFRIPVTEGRVPDWLQGEMVWESTQAAFTYMNWRFDLNNATSLTIADTEGATGPSPLLVVYPKEDLDEFALGIDTTLAVEAFHAGSPVVCDNDPSGDLCVYTGAAVEQRFTYIIHVFYGYQPPEGWRFSTEGVVPQPA